MIYTVIQHSIAFYYIFTEAVLLQVKKVKLTKQQKHVSMMPMSSGRKRSFTFMTFSCNYKIPMKLYAVLLLTCMKMFVQQQCTLIACSKLSTLRLTWLPIIPASILGSIISMADMASNRPNLTTRQIIYFVYTIK